MAQQHIDLGTADNDHTGDNLKEGGQKIEANFTDLYTNKADKASPVFTGTPAAPTATAGTNTTQIATTAFVKAAVDALLGGAPGALDTLKELADAINDDASFAATVTTALAGKQATSAVLTFLATLGTAALAPPIPTGRWMLGEGVGSTMSAAAAPGAGSMRMFPVRIRRAVTITALAARVSTASSGGKFQIAIYAADGATLMPTGAPLYSSGDQSTTTATLVGPTGLSVAIAAPGIYWFATNCDNGTAAFSVKAPNSTDFCELIGSSTSGGSVSNAANSTGVSKTQTYGTWSTLTGSFSTDGLADVGSGVPVIDFLT